MYRDMALAAHPEPVPHLPMRIIQRARSLAGALPALLRAPKAAPLRNLASMPLTSAGMAAIDFAAFHVGHGWGFLATGISLILVEKMIETED